MFHSLKQKVYTKGKSRQEEDMVKDPHKKLDMVTGPRCFSYKELKEATNNFEEDQVIGKGGSGYVYLGHLPDRCLDVAVKRMSSQSVQGEKVFMTEVQILGQLRHRNIVKLVGWCHEKKEFLIVYEFVPNKTLDFHLFHEQGWLPFEIRYRIALHLASALRYLQEEHEYELSIIHQDIKSANVFLDDDFNPKLGDFGLAHFVEHGEQLTNTRIVGTRGYVDPEYFINGRASEKSDVYSFGIVALEIASGKRAFELGNGDSPHLLEWVQEHYKRENVLAAADPKLGDSYVSEQMERLIIVGLACANKNSRDRPSFQDVIDVLNVKAPLPVVKLPPAHDAASMDDLFASESASATSTFYNEFHHSSMGDLFDSESVYATTTFYNEFLQEFNEQNYVSNDSQTHDQSIDGKVKISAAGTGSQPPVHVTASCVNLSASESSSSYHGSYGRNEVTFSSVQATNERNYNSNNSLTYHPLVASEPKMVTARTMRISDDHVNDNSEAGNISHEFQTQFQRFDGEFQRLIEAKKITYDELVDATNNFDEQMKLGQGGCGIVYEGVLPNMGQVAVKKIFNISPKGIKDYAKEVEITSQLKHRNLIKLLGWCQEKMELLLVFEYIPNGTLYDHLFKNPRRPLTWEERYKIAEDLVSALHYLHEECKQCVLHRDIKSSNVMLDLDYNAKVVDFGLARLADHEAPRSQTLEGFTPGYMPPESFNTGTTTKKTDVYSFGVVILEIVSGRKASWVEPDGNPVSIVDWFWQNKRRKLHQLVDPRLNGEYDKHKMKRLTTVGLWCTQKSIISRPSIKEVKNVLISEAPLPKL